ncbi:MAG: hypothetical protein LBO09_08635 [Candidatus Peribacteria bacterium]|jgi:hypothetical protein|nr:hypothetical protein [Candidatus Peribacteria bacterium]
MHELIHYFQPNLLPQSIKEAIPCILNASTTFMNYWSDNGHQEVEEQNWRKIIWELYKVKKGKFSDLTKLTDENISADYHLSNGYSYLL